MEALYPPTALLMSGSPKIVSCFVSLNRGFGYAQALKCRFTDLRCQKRTDPAKKWDFFSGPSGVAGSAPPASPSRVRVTGNTGVDPVPLTRPLGPRAPLTRLVLVTRATCSTSRRRRTRSPGDRILEPKILKFSKNHRFSKCFVWDENGPG